MDNKGEFSADDFVSLLIKEGTNASCDRKNEEFSRAGKLPLFYNEHVFKRGQHFFHQHIFAILFTKILGLITILAIPDLVQVLKFTGMSNEPMTAYKRYLATVFHMCVWYDSSFTPGSSLWKSIETVRSKHNSASQSSCRAGQNGISQKNMALTQFGFMGYAVLKTEYMGIHDAKKEDLEAFIHVWRVIGHVMGIEDRFNICRESLEETRDICKVLTNRIFKPEVEKHHSDYIHMSHAMISGMWSMMPVLEPNVFLYFIFTTICGANSNNNNNDKTEKDCAFKLNLFQKVYFYVIIFTMYTLKYTIFRLFHNYNMYLCLWLMRNCPFLAYYQFGTINSHVTIFTTEHTKYG